MERWHSFFFHHENYQFSLHEELLKRQGFYPLNAYLNYWVDANKAVMDSIPKSQLLILYTSEISNKLHKLADFLNIDESTLSQTKSRMNVTEKKYGILSKLDETFVANKIDTVCQQFAFDYKLNDLI